MKSLAISFSFLILSYATGAQTAQMVKDAQSIQTVLTDLAKAWNIHSAGQFSILFSEDAEFTDARGVGAYGRKEIEKFQEKAFSGLFKNCLLKITDRKIRFITVDIASVDAWWEMTEVKDKGEKGIPLRKGLFNFIMTRGDDKWYITVMHDMNLSFTE